MSTAWIVDAVRSPRGKSKNGSLTGIHPQQLMAQALSAIVARTQIDPKDIEDVILGTVIQQGEQAGCIARSAVLAADLPIEVPGVSINRFCGSGLEAVHSAAKAVMSGAEDCVIAGGVESMSRVPMTAAAFESNNPLLKAKHFPAPQGVSGDLIATLHGFSREDVDRFAVRSHQRAGAAQRNGWFARSLFPVIDPTTGATMLDADEYVRPETTLEALAALKPAFAQLGAMAVGPKGETVDEMTLQRYPHVTAIDHVHTAGNSSGIVDGSCAMVLASDDFVRAHGLAPRAKIRAMAACGSEPVIMLTGPVPAVRKALARAKMTVADVDLWEINEAFAAIPLQVIAALELDADRVNVNGGAIALGHPLGASGAMLLTTVVDELVRRNLSTAVVTVCIGQGMGIATIVERA